MGQQMATILEVADEEQIYADGIQDEWREGSGGVWAGIAQALQHCQRGTSIHGVPEAGAEGVVEVEPSLGVGEELLRLSLIHI